MVNQTNLDAVFGALADPTRRRIIERLSRRSLSIGEIAAEFPLSQPAISKHVRVLEDSGLIEREVTGRVHRLSLSPDGIASAQRWIETQRRYWSETLDRLDALLREQQPRKKKT